MIVKPAVPGSVIRDPHTKRRLPDEGGRVPDTSFWRRRLRDGDVVRIEKAQAPTPAPDAGVESGAKTEATAKKDGKR